MTSLSAASAPEIQHAINTALESAGLGPTFRVGLPVRVVDPAAGGPNWHFLDMLSGSIEEMTIATAILADARHKFTLAD